MTKMIQKITIVSFITIIAIFVLFPSFAIAVSVTNFVIIPVNNCTGAISAYTIQVNTTNFTALNITIPNAFSAHIPQAGDIVAEVDLWWDNPSPYYGYIKFTANMTSPETKLDVYADIGGGTATLTGMAVDYNEGSVTSILSPFGTHEERARLTLPTSTSSGYMNISGLPDNITNITVSVGEFVKNPTVSGDYFFDINGTIEMVNITSVYAITLQQGYNMIGWTSQTVINSSTLCNEVPYCDYVYKKSPDGSWITKHCGYPGGDFNISHGFGFLVYITQECSWIRDG